ncbi:hotdog family protein [Neolewinella agarilytica]|uniref:3-hydroxyacyl-[acyl-carrier-protein] dehydratase n=1 Tax=Neolewinella agarilytica TaxID=478744 RepID=A0A1H9AKW5_9BACT|nr:hypothetical protein [Neolewinella agarilytica]SEP77151.1 3-hydroxyacyl-[acyl-carrier-protein] dehydratase [Neolewinella agarilytica]
MHFIDSLFKVIKQENEPEGGEFKLQLNASHSIYKGHFPDNPITPGVCSLEIMTQLAAAHYDGFERPKKIDSIKYLGFVNPLLNPEVEVVLKIKKTGEGIWRVRGMLCADGKPAVKMVASYQNNIPNLKIKM